MNHKGQTLVTFILIIPVFILLAIILIDGGNLLSSNNHLKSVTKMIITETIQDINNQDLTNEIEKLYQKNNIPTDNLVISVHNNQLLISNYYNLNGIISKIINNNLFRVSIKLTGYNNNGKIIIEKG